MMSNEMETIMERETKTEEEEANKWHSKRDFQSKTARYRENGRKISAKRENMKNEATILMDDFFVGVTQDVKAVDECQKLEFFF